MSGSTSPNPRTRKVALPVGGIVPFSATDWPGRLTLSVFTQGCPLRCVYCHNPSLQGFAPTPYTFESALSLLEERRGLLDGMVISGGEPLSCHALPAAIAAVHAAGFEVGLHTSGYSPKRLAVVLDDPSTRPEWIGFDVKALTRDIPGVAGCTPAVAQRMKESLGLVARAAAENGMGLQLRTTLWHGSPMDNSLAELKELAAGYGHELVLQWARDCDSNGRYHGAGLAEYSAPRP
ncbi:anaerobic ribonucleoside-triphosphate reductase activating protein [Corynebacterium flavescens]